MNSTFLRYIGIVLLCFVWIFTVKASEDFNDKLKTDFYLEQARSHDLAPEQRLVYYDSLRVKMDSPRLAIEKGLLLEEMGRYSQALVLYRNADRIIPDESLQLKCTLLLRRAITEYFAGDQGITVERCYNLTSLEKPDSLAYMDVEANRLLAHLFEDTENLALCDMYMDRAALAHRRFMDSDAPVWLKELTTGKLHYTRCSMAIANKDFPLAFEEIKEAQRFLDRYWPKSFTAINTALIYHVQDEPDMAENFYSEIIKTQDNHPDHAMAILNYCELLCSRGEVEKAVGLLESHHKDLQRLTGTPWEISLYRRMAEVYRASGKTEPALDYYEKALGKSDSISEMRNRIYLDNLAERYEGRDVRSGNDMLAGTIRNQRVFLIVLIVLAVSASAAVIVLVRRGRRNNRRIQSLQTDLKSLNHLKDSQKKIAEDSLLMRSRELSAMTMHMTRLNEELNKIQTELDKKSLSKEDLVANIRSSLRVLSAQENVWEMFKVYFEEVNQKFFDKLFKVCPDLTKSEMRMCAFILAGMTTKEIAAATNRSTRTVDCIKYNLRRKLNITESTETFIRRLSATDDEAADNI